MILDKEVRRELEEAWLCEMAFELKDAKKLISANGFELKIHLCKCFLFRGTQWYNHWLKEAANFCVRCDDIRVKPKAKRLSRELFLSDDYICSEIETADDAKIYLNFAIDRCPEVDRDDATNEEALRFLDLWEDLRYELANMMADEDNFNRTEYEEVINQAIINNVY